MIGPASHAPEPGAATPGSGALAVDCPHCHASVGFPCHDPRARKYRPVAPHASRRSQAIAEGLL